MEVVVLSDDEENGISRWLQAANITTTSQTESSSQPLATLPPTTSQSVNFSQPLPTMASIPGSLTASSTQLNTTMVATTLPEGSRQPHATIPLTTSLTASSRLLHTTMAPTTLLIASSSQSHATIVPTSLPEDSRQPHVTIFPTTSLTHATMVPTATLPDAYATMAQTASSSHPNVTNMVPTTSLPEDSRQPHATMMVPTTSLTAISRQSHATMVPTTALPEVHATMASTTSMTSHPNVTNMVPRLPTMSLPEGSGLHATMAPATLMTTSTNHPNVTNMAPTTSQVDVSGQPHATVSYLSCDSPPIKRMRSELVEQLDEDESTWCPICLEPWTCSGDHRMVSISCGHVFGRKCIHRWISQGNRKCPTCNRKAILKHIRNIFTSKLIAVDNTELKDAQKNLADEKKKRTDAEKRLGEAVINALVAEQVAESALQNIKKKMVDLEKQNKILQNQKPRSVSPTRPQMDDYIIDDKKYVMVDTYSATSGSKALSHQQISMDLVYSMCEPGRNYGFHKLNIHVGKKSFFSIRSIHTNLIMDASFHDEAYNTLLSASCDNTLKLTSLNTNLPVQTIQTPNKVWSCAWPASDVTKIYAGLVDGKVLLYDTRNTSNPVRSYFKDGNSIVSLEYIPKGHGDVRSSGLLMCTTKMLCLWEEVTPTRHVPRVFPLPEGENTCMRVGPKNKKIVVSQRHGEENHNVRHCVMEFKTGPDEVVSCGVVEQFKCGEQLSGHKCGATLYRAPFDQDSLLLATANEDTSHMRIWNENPGTILQNLPHGSGQPRNILGFKAGSSNDMIAFLKSDKLSLFKWS